MTQAPAPFDWDSEMKMIEQRLDDHLTDEETASRLAQIDRDVAPVHRERTWQSILGLIGSWVIGLVAVALVGVML